MSERIINFASIFTYVPGLKHEYTDYRPALSRFEKDGTLTGGSAGNIDSLLQMQNHDQQATLDDKSKSEPFLRALFEVIDKIRGHDDITTFALLYVDGLLEDNRERILNLVSIQHNIKGNSMDLVHILLQFLIRNNSDNNNQRDLAARILAFLIEACGYEKHQKEANDLLNWVHQADTKSLSIYAYTHIVMYMVKINELASQFYDLNGMGKLSNFLDNECMQDYQIAYNVLVSLWIMSFHDYARLNFEDRDQDLIEKVIKMLDFYNKEKVVRLVLLIFDSLSSSKLALEIMSDLNALEII